MERFFRTPLRDEKKSRHRIKRFTAFECRTLGFVLVIVYETVHQSASSASSAVVSACTKRMALADGSCVCLFLYSLV